ncbi:MAG: DUF4878 domain-containing protein [Actinomycetota bacterium]|nr:DUF4878 domain-containing protein [Actinomycetota bacterium]MDD5667227.1 DUF4878 domain-containing protein [Actinomycetota bacterium]
MKKIIITLLVLALSVSVLALAGCGGSDSGDGDSPEKVVEQFMKSTVAEDADAVYDLLSEADQAEVTDKEELVAGSADAIDSYTVGKATISGDEARVPSTIVLTDLDSTLEFDVVLVKEGGAWKISLEGTGASMDDAFDKIFEDMDLEDLEVSE